MPFEFTILNQDEYYLTQAVFATCKERNHLIQTSQTRDFTDLSTSLVFPLGLGYFQTFRCQSCIVIDMLAKHCLEFHIGIYILIGKFILISFCRVGEFIPYSTFSSITKSK